MKGTLVLVSWIVSVGSGAGAAVLATAQNVITPDQVAALRDFLVVPDTPGVSWKEWAVWFGGANGILWNPVVQRFLSIGVLILERVAHRPFPHEAPEPPR